jgi:hypothetical protein
MDKARQSQDVESCLVSILFLILLHNKMQSDWSNSTYATKCLPLTRDSNSVELITIWGIYRTFILNATIVCTYEKRLIANTS